MENLHFDNEHRNLFLSIGNSKIGYSLNFGKTPGYSCSGECMNCGGCYPYCYAKRAERYTAVKRNNWNNYMSVIRCNRSGDWSLLNDMICTGVKMFTNYKGTKTVNHIVRYNQSGDYISVSEIMNTATIAESLPGDWVVWSFTKRYEWIATINPDTLPVNMIQYVSSYIDRDVPEYVKAAGWRIAYTVSDINNLPGYIPKDALVCCGDCTECHRIHEDNACDRGGCRGVVFAKH